MTDWVPPMGAAASPDPRQWDQDGVPLSDRDQPNAGVPDDAEGGVYVVAGQHHPPFDDPDEPLDALDDTEFDDPTAPLDTLDDTEFDDPTAPLDTLDDTEFDDPDEPLDTLGASLDEEADDIEGPFALATDENPPPTPVTDRQPDPSSHSIPSPPLSQAAVANDQIDPEWANRIATACDEWVIGQGQALRTLWLGVLAGGHVLIQGPSGTGKSVLTHTLVSILGLPTQHVTFTSDLSPKDVIGSVVYDPDQHEWVPHVGPLFSHAVLIDGINRAPGTVQTALLTAMSHRHVTIHRHTIPLPIPFVVLGTQTPDLDGTYPLSQSFMDRWMVSVAMGYPSLDAEQQLVKKAFDAPSSPTPITTPEHLLLAQSAVANVYIDDRLLQQIVQLVAATRRPDILQLPHLTNLIERGASPRASHALVAMAKATAWLDHRTYVIPDDIKAVVKPVLRHRVAMSYDAHSQAITPDLVIDQLMAGHTIS